MHGREVGWGGVSHVSQQQQPAAAAACLNLPFTQPVKHMRFSHGSANKGCKVGGGVAEVGGGASNVSQGGVLVAVEPGGRETHMWSGHNFRSRWARCGTMPILVFHLTSMDAPVAIHDGNVHIPVHTAC